MMHFRPADSKGPMYTPMRDITVLYPDVLRTVETLLFRKLPPELQALSDAAYLSEEDLAETLADYARLFELASQAGDNADYRVVQKALAASGFLERPPAARIIVLYLLGTVITSTFYGSFLDVVLPQADPHGQLRRMASLSVRMHEYAAAGPLQRWWLRWKSKRQQPDLLRDPTT